MHTGTISALDSQERFGLIDADDGRILPFNRDALESPLCGLQIGARVEFLAGPLGEQTRAVAVRPARPILKTGGNSDALSKRAQELLNICAVFRTDVRP